jgi:hypothetical protein
LLAWADLLLVDPARVTDPPVPRLRRS